MNDTIYDRFGRPMAGPTVVEDLRDQLQEAWGDRRLLERDAELLAWHVLNGTSQNVRGELEPRDRIRLVEAATEVWQRDPQAGASVDLLNDFVFGRGVPRPRAKDIEVQKVLDETWDDPDNKLVLTSYDALVEKGTDLQLQANVFFLIFEGDDGKVKLGLLDHDKVRNVVRSEDNRLRILYFAVEEQKYEWDYNEDREKPVAPRSPDGKLPIVYYEHYRNVDDELAGGGMPKTPPQSKIRPGRVYHLSINKTSEMAFGVPTMRRLMRWFSAYNEFMTSRVDVVKAAAAFIMKRRVRGGEAAVQRIAAQRLNAQSSLATEDPWLGQAAPRPASILNENDSVVHEALNLSTNAGNALQDGQMIRSQVSAATRFPQHYLGDAGSANLATATAMELPVLKAVEARQEVWEGLFRALADRAIEVAVKTGRLDPSRGTPEDLMTRAEQVAEAHPTQVADEAATQRDLTYEFGLPSPLKRMLGDYVNALANVAKTIDPNGVNTDLSRLVLTLALQELEVEDPASYVEKILPPGYVDPIMQAQLQAAAQGGVPGGAEPGGGAPAPFGGRGAPGQQPGQQNPYGAPSPSSSNTPASYGDASNNPYNSNRGVRSRTPEQVQETRFEDLDPEQKAPAERRASAVERLWREDVRAVLDEELAGYTAGANGNGRH